MATDSHRKDLWDRLTALATILVPAAIALAGHFIAQGLKEAENKGQEQQAAQASANAVGTLLVAAFQNIDNDNGIYNVAVVLAECAPPVLAAHRQQVRQFIALARTKGPRTAAKTAVLEKRLADAAAGASPPPAPGGLAPGDNALSPAPPG
jgi:hypothetical protein